MVTQPGLSCPRQRTRPIARTRGGATRARLQKCHPVRLTILDFGLYRQLRVAVT